MTLIENEKREDLIDAGNLDSKSRSLPSNIQAGKQLESDKTIDQHNQGILKTVQTQLKILQQFILKNQDE